jgi:hypothetical protein
MKTSFIKKERFIKDFCKKKGWNVNKLTSKQLIIITNHPDYKKI